MTDPKAGKLSFDERFSLLVDAEHLARDNRRLARLLKNADLRFGDACVEEVDTGASRGLPRETLNQLSTGAWIAEHLDVLVSGKTGVGKSYLACALGQFGCRRGFASSTAGCPDSSPSSRWRRRRAPTTAGSRSWPRSTS